MLSLQWEPIFRLLDDGVEAMLHAHWQEASIDLQAAPLDVDWSRLLTRERQGDFKVLGLRKHGRLIGYSAFSIGPHALHRRTIYAENQAVYVRPQSRGQAGVKILLGAEAMCREAGAVKISYLSPHRSGKKLGAVLTKLGYRHSEDYFCKLLG